MFKDQVLDSLASTANVAQFVSFSTDMKQRFSRIYGFEANHEFPSAIEAITSLLEVSPEKSVNVRSFRPDQPQGNEFHYGLQNPADAFEHVKRLANLGFHTIVNETVDVNDGGVSGVLQGGCMEFAPGVVPRFVEKDSAEPIPALPRNLAMEMLRIVYGFTPALDYPEGYRVEFSIHPKPRGWKNSHTIIWEEERVSEVPIHPFFTWPNKFSILLGDKIYGLLLAHLLGACVPRTTVFARNKHISLFTFGDPTGAAEYWTRTCPRIQEPGNFSTLRGWHDPFALMDSEDPDNQALASCIVQEEVASLYSGALITESNNKVVIEGVVGFGDRFMLGDAKPVDLPISVVTDILKIYTRLSQTLGATRFEWAHDGHSAWILQLHTGITKSTGRIIYPGNPENWVSFNVKDGLPCLRELIESTIKTKNGIKVHGHVGMSSHIADLLRKSKIPSVLQNIQNN